MFCHAKRVNVPDMDEAVTAELRAELARQRLSQRTLATKIGKSAMWVNRRLSGEGALTFDDAELICGALGVALSDVIAKAQALNTGATA